METFNKVNDSLINKCYQAYSSLIHNDYCDSLNDLDVKAVLILMDLCDLQFESLVLKTVKITDSLSKLSKCKV